MSETPAASSETAATDKTAIGPAGGHSAMAATATTANATTAANPAAAGSATTAGHAQDSASGAAGGSKKAGRASGLGSSILEVLAGLKSPDKPTRNGALLFVASLCGIVLVFILAGVHIVQVRRELREQAQSDRLAEYMKKQAEEANKKFTTQALGTFNIQLKPIDGQKPASGVMNLAEVDIDARCDEKETCDALAEGIAQVRNEVTTALGPMDRDELYTKDGKARLKKKILDRLNAWLPKGKVDDLYISKLIIS